MTKNIPTTTAARHSSESNDHYTPREIIAAARATMGIIDLDPASCALANDTVHATRFFDIEANGFARGWAAGEEGEGSTRWPSCVFLNPPGGWCDSMGQRVIKASKTAPACTESGACGLAAGHVHDGCESAAKQWWWKLQKECAKGAVAQAVFVGFSVEILQTTQVDIPLCLLPMLDYPLCFPSRRIAYLTPKSGKLVVGASPPHSTVIAYIGPNKTAFAQHFSALGRVVNLGAS